MTIPPEMIEAVARIIDPMSLGLEGVFDGPVQVGNCIRAREQADAVIRTLAPMMAEVMAEVIDMHKPDASFDDSGAGALERNALLDNVAAEVRAKGKEMADG